MRKYFFILLSCVMLVLIVACGNVTTSQTPSNSVTTSSTSKIEGSSTIGNTTSNVISSNVSSSTTIVESISSSPIVEELSNTTLYVVGDSTACDYSKGLDTMTDDTYYYPRYGYASQLYNYFNEKVTISNLALSGRSSKSFLIESNYQTLKNNIKEGDYLLIGFGHNDEKNDDEARFTDASKDLTDSTSFKYSLYENYIKIAEDKGATPILCTPIVRLDKTNSYTGSYVHDLTSKGIGDYRQAIIDLGKEKNIEVIDLTTITKNIYASLGYDEARYLHSMPSKYSNGEVVPSVDGVDGTHLNIYGAKTVSYQIANTLSISNCRLGRYVNENITQPTKENDLVKWKNAYASAYDVPDFSNYEAPSHFTTISEGWFGTAFGDCGGEPSSEGNGYIAKETESGIYQVGQSSSSNKGKITSSSEGFAFLGKQISINDNFTITCDAKILTTASVKQAGFGLMLRDDCYLPKKDSSIVSNYVASGLLCNDADMNVLFSRETKTLSKGDSISGLYQVGDTATLSITRLGQVVTTSITYKGQTYTQTYTDFDFTSIDNENFYIGMFATRGTTVEFTNVVYTYTGEALGA